MMKKEVQQRKISIKVPEGYSIQEIEEDPNGVVLKAVEKTEHLNKVFLNQETLHMRVQIPGKMCHIWLDENKEEVQFFYYPHQENPVEPPFLPQGYERMYHYQDGYVQIERASDQSVCTYVPTENLSIADLEKCLLQQQAPPLVIFSKMKKAIEKKPVNGFWVTTFDISEPYYREGSKLHPYASYLGGHAKRCATWEEAKNVAQNFDLLNQSKLLEEKHFLLILAKEMIKGTIKWQELLPQYKRAVWGEKRKNAYNTEYFGGCADLMVNPKFVTDLNGKPAILSMQDFEHYFIQTVLPLENKERNSITAMAVMEM